MKRFYADLLVLMLFAPLAAESAPTFVGEWEVPGQFLLQLYPNGEVIAYQTPQSSGALNFRRTLQGHYRTEASTGSTYRLSIKPVWPNAMKPQRVDLTFLDDRHMRATIISSVTGRTLDDRVFQPTARQICSDFVQQLDQAHDVLWDPGAKMAEMQKFRDDLSRLQQEAGDRGQKEIYEVLIRAYALVLDLGAPHNRLKVWKVRELRKHVTGYFSSLKRLFKRMSQLIAINRDAERLLRDVLAIQKRYDEIAAFAQEMDDQIHRYRCIGFDTRHGWYPNPSLTLPDYVL